MLRLIDVAVRRGGVRVLEGVELEILPGRVFWVTGPNGAGKSSLLRTMAMLEPPAAGRVVQAPPPGQRFLYFHSEMALPRFSTVAAWERLVEALLPGGSAAPVTPLWPEVAGGRKVGRLSTGERKRLLLDALLRRPGPLLLDEPYEHLSPEARTALTGILDGRARETVVVVATNHSTARAERDGGVRLGDGVATRIGPARQRAAP